MTITLQIKGESVTLTVEEARALFDELANVFGATRTVHKWGGPQPIEHHVIWQPQIPPFPSFPPYRSPMC